MDDYSYTINRELSWLNFDERCLDEARDETVPLFERLQFIRIFESNMDEFFMVRVGKLADRIDVDDPSKDNKSGMTADEQYDPIADRVQELYYKKDQVFSEIARQFRREGVYNFQSEELSRSQSRAIYKYFLKYIKPALQAVTIDPDAPLPFMKNKYEYIILKLEGEEGLKYGLIEVPDDLSQIIRLPTATGHPFIRTIEVIFEYAETLFPSMQLKEKTRFRVTRNAFLSTDDVIPREDIDYPQLTEEILRGRQTLPIVRLEMHGGQAERESFEELLLKAMELHHDQIFFCDSPFSMDYVDELEDYLEDDFIRSISYPPFTANEGPDTGFEGDLITRVEEKDWLFIYPYDSMENYLSLMEAAASDERVDSIRISIYRLAKNSRLVDVLCQAAQNGKKVMVVMELRARFDEQHNLNSSEELLAAGCRVIYGMAGYKNHSKVCLISYRKEDGKKGYITQIGTGNYNEKTARIYSDLCLLTADREIGKDAQQFFRNMQIGNLDGKYKQLLQAPSSLKPAILQLMDREIKKGEDGYICLKMNQLTDRDFIDRLQKASDKGVTVRLIIRGICCLRPGLPGKTEQVEIHSIVGRFLEHARIYVFGKKDPDIYIGSADLMTRNTEHRVEILAPVHDPAIKDRLLHFMEIQLQDNVKGRVFGPDGRMHPIHDDKEPLNAQAYYMENEKLFIQGAGLGRREERKRPSTPRKTAHPHSQAGKKEERGFFSRLGARLKDWFSSRPLPPQ